jgi:hypothetical protein
MSLGNSLRRYNARTDQWLRNHPVCWFCFAAATPAIVYTALALWRETESVTDALRRGLLFGVVVAIGQILGRKLVPDRYHCFGDSR